MPTDTQRLSWLARNFRDFRFIGGASMDGHVPCWSCFTVAEGRTTRKTLREAIDASMDFSALPDPAAALAERDRAFFRDCEEKLPFALHKRTLAQQCADLGLAVGDVIVGRETYGGGGWSDCRLTLLFVGEVKALFKVERRSSLEPDWRPDGESANWCLDGRQWNRVRQALPI